ncbi:PASTA domain-containing protein [Paenibacillus hodogayensis]|uniref:PASTA domain-containing protein n=1 Tax=Paenibacillus hodogayensis TaxID=279208 RepID=A0ABV5W386_9BACL
MRPISDRYELKQQLAPLRDGQLYEGKDLSLQRTVFVYSLKLQDEPAVREYVRKLGSAAHQGGTDSPFLHVLDAEIGTDSIHVIISYKPGCSLRQFIAKEPYSYQNALTMAADLGQALLDAATERPMDFSIGADNLWVTEDGVINVINTWECPAEGSRLAHELSSLLTQLLAHSQQPPAGTDEIAALLGNALPALPAAKKEDFVATVQDAWKEKLTLASLLPFIRMLQPSAPGTEPISSVPSAPAAPQTTPLWTEEEQEEDDEPVRSRRRSFRTGKRLAVGLASVVGVALVAVISVPLIDSLNRSSKKSEPAPVVAEQTPKTSEPVKNVPAPPKDTSQTSASTNNPIIPVPTITGLSKEVAEKLMLDSGLRYEFYLETNDKEAGLVFKQEPLPNAQVEKGSSVTFWISKGPVKQ